MMKAKRKKPARSGKLYIISAPSGAGKTTLCSRLCRRIPSLRLSVSHTTRSPRKSETSGVDYYFISRGNFISMIRRKGFAEWAVVHGNYYGTSKKELSSLCAKGYDVILDIDVQGAVQIRRALPGVISIFILPPSLKVLRERLRGRKTEKPSDLKKRLENAREEMRHYKQYDYIVFNDDLRTAVRDLESIFISRKLLLSEVDSHLLKFLK